MNASQRVFLALCSLLATTAVHCRPTTPTQHSQTMTPPARPSGGQWNGVLPTVEAVAAPTIPVCTAQGEELISIAALSNGVPSEPSLARRTSGGAVAFVSENAAHDKTLTVTLLRTDGHPDGDSKLIVGATNPSAPSLVAYADGYALAWRDQTAVAGQERIVLVSLDASGVVRPWPTALQLPVIGAARDPLVGRAAQWRDAAAIALGPPTLATQQNSLVLGFVTQTNASKIVVVELTATGPTARESTASTMMSTSERLALGYVDNHWQWIAQDTAAPQALWSAVVGQAPAQLARAASAPSFASSAAQTMYSYVTRSGTASVLRLRAVQDSAAPLTAAVFAQSNRVEPVLVSLTDSLLGVVTLSHATDDATGSINISLVNSQGEWVGRHAALSSMRLRSARTVAAASPAHNGDAWVLFDARADDGNPVLALTKLSCDSTREANAGALATASMRQEPSPPDEAPVRSDHGSAVQLCQATATVTTVAQHGSADDAITRETAIFSAALSDGQLVVFTTHRAQATAPLVHSAPSVITDARGTRVTTGPTVPATAPLLAAQSLGRQAVAVSADGWILRSTGRGTLTAIRSALTEVRSAQWVRNGSALVAFGHTESGPSAVYWLGVREGVPSAPVQISAPVQGSGQAAIAVEDALKVGALTHVLLSSAVAATDPDTRVRALLTVSDTPSARALLQRRDPMADPLAIGQHRAVLHTGPAGLQLVWTDHETVRVGQLDHGMVRQPRSVFATFTGGGHPLGFSHAGNGELVVTLTPGSNPTVDDSPDAPYTFVILRADGSARAVSTRAPGPAAGIPQLGYGFMLQNQLQIVYARPAGNRALEWVTQRVDCSSPSRETLSSTAPTTTTTTATAPTAPVQRATP
jgi:hypothetical protein